MVWQGKIEFSKPITIDGKPHGIEHVEVLEAWASEHIGRVAHEESTGTLWFAGPTSWKELTPGGIGIHEHNSLYYTETEIDGMFEGTNGGKQIINWTNINNKPVLFAPEAHTHDYTADFAAIVHTHDYTADFAAIVHTHDYTADFAAIVHTHDYTADFAAIVHTHEAVDTPYNNTTSLLSSLNVQEAIDEVLSVANTAIESASVFELTTGTPLDTPVAGTCRFDADGNTLYIFNGTEWKSFYSNN